MNSQLLSYPAAKVLQQIQTALKDRHVILQAPTGSGKTTVIPPALAATSLFENKKIYLLEPRRIGARAAACRISSLLGEKVGNHAGYITRFDRCVSDDTQIIALTLGVFLEKLQNNPDLDDVGLIIFDEFHERSIAGDICFAFCLELCSIQENLRLLVMSATLNSDQLIQLFDKVEVIEAEGRFFPVSETYHPVAKSLFLENAIAQVISQEAQREPGTILAFLPGVAEIKRTKRQLQDLNSQLNIIELFGDLPAKEQDKALAPHHDNKSRIILATPVAETSLTIDNVTLVIDSGLYKHPVYSPDSGMTHLKTSRISQASAEQRKGRAGRLQPGRCIRLWERYETDTLLPYAPPEILHGDLIPLVLELARWGCTDPKELTWLDPPRSGNFKQGLLLLQRLHCLDKNNKITARGKKIAQLPVHPRLGHMLLQAKIDRTANTACYLAALLSDRDILVNSQNNPDLRSRIEIFLHPDHKTLPGVKQSVKQRVEHQVKRLRNRLGISQQDILPEKAGLLLSYAYPDRIGIEQKRNVYILSNGKQVHLSEGSLSSQRLITAAHLDGKSGRIFLGAPIVYEELALKQPELIQNNNKTVWNSENQTIQATNETLIGKALFKSRTLPLSATQDDLLEVFIEGVQKSGSTLLPWTKKSRETQKRIQTLHHFFPNQWPDVSDERLMDNLKWLAPFCVGLTKASELKHIDFACALLSTVDYNKQRMLDDLAPTHLTVPSNSKIRLQYSGDASPVLPVRIQEVFGLTATPHICNGKIPLSIHLLSPAGRPVQITSDLVSFWKHTYPEVRKELAGRYPKHYWPQDPATAIPTRKTKKQM